MAAISHRAPMVIVYSGDSERVPDWSAEPARPPSEPPPSEGPRDESPASEPFLLAGELEEQSPASAGAARVQPPEGVGWRDSELGSGARPVLSPRGDGVAGASDRLTPLGPPWSEPAPPLRVAAPAPAKGNSRWHLWTAALSGSALLAIVYFAFSAAKPDCPLAAESARPESARLEPKIEQVKTQPRPAPELPAVSAVAAPPLAPAVDAKVVTAPAPAPARPATTTKAAAAPAAGKTHSAPDAASGSTRVRLEVIPTDAKVGRRGFTQKGPPYNFEVPKGKRVELEVVRKGYVTRKVTLDGRSSRVVIGLAKTRSTKR